jgi:hypothetical protein
MENKLRKLLTNFSFAPIREVYAGSLATHAVTLNSDAA